jgi:hypothetical protein
MTVALERHRPPRHDELILLRSVYRLRVLVAELGRIDIAALLAPFFG